MGTASAELYGTEPTEAERAALVAIVAPGAKYSTAAADLGISKAALRRRLERLYRRLGVNSSGQAAHALRIRDS